MSTQHRSGNRTKKRPTVLKHLSRRARVGLLALLLISSWAPIGATPASALTVNNEEPPGVEGFQQILNWGGWMVTVLGVLGLFAVGGGMILQHRRGEGGEQVGKLGLVLGGLIVAVAAGPLVNALA